MNEKKPILSICIPTYNRAEILKENVQRYASVKDLRVCFIIRDNCSTDGTKEWLSSLNYDNVIYRANCTNIGGTANGLRLIQDVNTEYLLYVLDKDYVDINYLSSFLEVLEQIKPQWGMINVMCTKPESPIVYNRGIHAIRNTSTYAPKHPSGFFVKKSLIESYIPIGFQKLEEENFTFSIELFQLFLGVKYDMMVVNYPMIVTEKLNNKTTKSYSYTAKNCWFLYDARATYYSTFLSEVLKLNINKSLQETIVKEMTESVLKNVSIGLRTQLENPMVCEHYYMESRHVTPHEMYGNMQRIMRLYKKILSQSGVYSMYQDMALHLFAIKIYLKSIIKDIIRK